MPPPVQLNLFPDRRIEPRDEHLSLAALPPNDALMGEPGPNLGTVKDYGVVVPIVVVERSTGKLEVAAGRRRIKAARAAGLVAIPARIYQSDDAIQHVLSLVENAGRSANEASEATTLRAMVERGMDEKALLESTGMEKSTLRARLVLLRLIPALWEAFVAGKIPPKVAVQAAKFGRESQEHLASIVAATGTLKPAHVREEKAALKAAEPVQESMDLEDEPDAEADIAVPEPPEAKAVPESAQRHDDLFWKIAQARFPNLIEIEPAPDWEDAVLVLNNRGAEERVTVTLTIKESKDGNWPR